MFFKDSVSTGYTGSCAGQGGRGRESSNQGARPSPPSTYPLSFRLYSFSYYSIHYYHLAGVTVLYLQRRPPVLTPRRRRRLHHPCHRRGRGVLRVLGSGSGHPTCIPAAETKCNHPPAYRQLQPPVGNTSLNIVSNICN